MSETLQAMQKRRNYRNAKRIRGILTGTYGMHDATSPEEAITDLLVDLLHYCHEQRLHVQPLDTYLTTAKRHHMAEIEATQ